jgi:HEAT repeat protein
MKTLVRFALVCLVGCLAGRVWAEDVRGLVTQLKSRDVDARRKAATALAEAGPDAKPAVPSLITALKDQDLYVRRFAAQALGKIGPDAKSAVPALSKALKDDQKQVAEAAAEALGKIRVSAVRPLADAVKDKGNETAVRRKAIEALGGMGAEAKSAVPVLTDALKDRDIQVDAATALGDIGPDAKSAVQALTEVTKLKGGKKNKAFKKAAADALQKIQGAQP